MTCHAVKVPTLLDHCRQALAHIISGQPDKAREVLQQAIKAEEGKR